MMNMDIIKFAKCIHKRESTHPDVKAGRYYELVKTLRRGRTCWLVLKLENGAEILQPPADYLIIDRDFEAA